jgi:hypothetical protein
VCGEFDISAFPQAVWAANSTFPHSAFRID